MRATTAHRTPERMADETCTRVWAWMIDKCRRKMNGGVRYITTEILQRRGDTKKQREREKEEGRRLQFLRLLKTLAAKHKRTEKKKN